MSRFAISDIHGCSKTFSTLLQQIDFSKTDELFLLGDYIDRGPDSKGVIDTIWELQANGYQVHCLKGNHEEMLLDAKNNMDKQRLWLRNGGLATSESFDANFLEDIPAVYIDWISDLPCYLETEGYLLVHAGLNFEITNPLEDTIAMLWIRRWYDSINTDWLGNRVIVHGHTPTSRPTIQCQLEELDRMPALVIDNGCVYPRLDMGQLIAFDLDARKLHFCERVD